MHFRISPFPATLVFAITLVSVFSHCSNQHSATKNEQLPDSQATAEVNKDTSSPNPARSYREIYEGVLPCADCEGIRTTFRIAPDYQSYELIEEYLGKGVEPRLETGKLNTERGFGNDEDATVYILNFDKSADEQRFFVRLTNDSTGVKMLDKNQQEIHSDFNYFLRRTGP